MGRRCEMEVLVGRIEASAQARERTRVILLTICGPWSVREGCRRLRVSRTRFQDLRRRMLEFAARALEARPAGRPRSARSEPEAVRTLRREVRELRAALRRTQTELWIAQSGAGEAVEARRLAKAVRP